MNKKIIIFFVALFLIISLGTISMIEFYYAKDSGRMPLLSIKSENRAKQYEKYSSLIYDVYKCYSGKIYAVGKRKKPVCNRVILYKDGYYVNINNLKISQKDYQSIYDVSHKLDEIENFVDSKEVENAVIISNEFERNSSKLIKTIKSGKEIVNVRVFKDLIKNEYGDYLWKYMEDDESYYKCEKDNLYKEYINGTCIGEWYKLEYSDKWCELAPNSYNIDIRQVYKMNCE